MGFFGKILDKLSFGKKAHAAEIPPQESAAPAGGAAPAAPAPQVLSDVDVVALLEEKAAACGQKLNWKVSIADLLKLLELDNSLAARKELAAELGCPADKIGGDYSQMNMWLHKTVLRKLAENGGNIPKELLD